MDRGCRRSPVETMLEVFDIVQKKRRLTSRPTTPSRRRIFCPGLRICAVEFDSHPPPHGIQFNPRLPRGFSGYHHHRHRYRQGEGVNDNVEGVIVST
jgi:hypothetical protein